MAFVKRLVITMTQCPSNIAAGLIYLISEIFRTRGDLSVMLSNSASNEISSLNEKNLLGNFDPEKREPSFAIAKDNTVSLWEASLFQHHFHPSVRAFSNNWLGPEHKINYNGDPVTDFSISTFLNRFSYKNPKTKNIEKVHRPLPKVEDPVNLEHLVGNSNDSITPDKAFFHKYFTTRGRLVTEGKSKDKSKQRSSADSDLDEEEIDDFANTLAENLMKSVEGNKLNRADIDDDLDFSSDSDASDDTSGYETGAVDAPEENEDVSNEDDSAAFDELDVDDIDDIPISDEEDLEQKPSSKKRKSKLEGGNTKRKRSNDAENVFASAEEFEVDMEDIVQTYDKKGKKSKQSNKEK
jgi:ribosome biogenesis protein MAK21